MDSLIIKILLPIIVKMLGDLLTADNLRKYGDKFFDFLEDAIADSETTIDDQLCLPIIKLLRRELNVPDND